MANENVFQPRLARIMDRFHDCELCLVTSPSWNLPGSRKTAGHNDLLKHLRAEGIAFIRVAAIGLVDPMEPSPEPIKTEGVMVFNRMGEDKRRPAFGETILGLAQKEGATLMLHRLAGGPVKLLVVETGQRLKHYPNLASAVPEYFALTRNDMSFESLGRLRDYQNSPWFAAMIAQRIGEVT